METILKEIDVDLNKIKNYLKLDNYNLVSVANKEKIKEMCVAKLCMVLGLDCARNCKNEFFEVFSNVMAEAVCEQLHIQIHIAKENIRFVKYSGVNFITRSCEILKMNDIDQAILDIFIFVEKNKNLIEN